MEKTMNNPRQIYKYQTKKALMAFVDNLQVEDGANASSIHNTYSKIRIFTQDYSQGVGEKNIIATANLDPSTMKYIAESILAGQAFNFYENKILAHKKDDNGRSPVTKVTVKYCTNDKNEPLSVPWMFVVENGTGVAQTTDVGGTMCKKDSYKQMASVRIYLSELDCYKCMISVRDYIRNFEIVNFAPLMKARSIFEDSLKQEEEK